MKIGDISGRCDEGSELSFDDALQLLRVYGGGEPWVRHCIAVSSLAARITDICSVRWDIDRAFIRRASLLHDIGRYRSHDPIMHGVEGYRLLVSLGHYREAYVCASHILFGISCSEAAAHGLPAQDFFPTTFEEKLVPVVDSLVDFDRPTTLEKRVASIRQRYKDNGYFLGRIDEAAQKVKEFISYVDAECGVSLERLAAETLEYPVSLPLP